jgi:hypothetical protein
MRLHTRAVELRGLFRLVKELSTKAPRAENEKAGIEPAFRWYRRAT